MAVSAFAWLLSLLVAVPARPSCRSYRIHSTISRIGFLKALGGGVSAAILPEDMGNGVPRLTTSCVDDEIPAQGGYSSACMRRDIKEFHLSDGREIVIRQDFNRGATGLAVWQSGKALASYMESLGREFWVGRRVVELGCGAGLCSLVAHYLGAQDVVATDGNSQVLALAARNIETNRLPDPAGSISAVPLQWGVASGTGRDGGTQGIFGGVDVVIGSDLTYTGQTWIQLAKTVADLLDGEDNNTKGERKACGKGGGTGRFLYCSAGHSQFGGEIDGFRTVAESMGLEWELEFEFSIPGSSSLGDSHKFATIAWIRRKGTIDEIPSVC